MIVGPYATFPNDEIQERDPETETIRTFRLSLNLLGDDFVEALAGPQERLTRKEMVLAHLERVQTPLPYLLDQIFHKRLEQRVGIVRIGSNRLGRPDLQ
jgi:hypothetical protein